MTVLSRLRRPPGRRALARQGSAWPLAFSLAPYGASGTIAEPSPTTVEAFLAGPRYR